METQTALTHGSCRLWCGAVDSSLQWKVMGHPAISAINPPGRPIDTVQNRDPCPTLPWTECSEDSLLGEAGVFSRNATHIIGASKLRSPFSSHNYYPIGTVILFARCRYRYNILYPVARWLYFLARLHLNLDRRPPPAQEGSTTPARR